jgi:hypothetical protein
MAGKRFQFSIRSLLVAVTFIAAIFGILIYEIQKSRIRIQRQKVEHNFKQIVVSLKNYAECYGRLPFHQVIDKQGKALSSWRFQLKHFIEIPDWRANFRAPWNDPVNAYLACNPNAIYCFGFFKSDELNPCMTNVFAIAGPGTAFDGQQRQNLPDMPPELIILAEVRNSGIHWMAPGDFGIRTMPTVCGDPQGKGISGTAPGGFCVAFADGEVWFLSNDTPFEELKKFFTIKSCKKHSREECLGPYRL